MNFLESTRKPLDDHGSSGQFRPCGGCSRKFIKPRCRTCFLTAKRLAVLGRGEGLLRRHRVELLQGAIAISAMLSACGCTPHSYAGIDLRPGRAPADLQALAEQARAGDKQAQMDLSDRFAAGDSIAADPRRAEQLLEAAASDRGGRRLVFVPRGNGAVQAMPVNTGPFEPGLSAAKQRLAARRGAGRARDPLREIDRRTAETALAGLATRTRFAVYPAQPVASCAEAARHATVEEYLDTEILGALVAVPPNCLLTPPRISEVVTLARTGHAKARTAYLALILELHRCDDAPNRALLLAASDQGDAVASIVAGNLLRLCGSPVEAAHRYRLAGDQGVPNAASYYRPLEIPSIPRP
ncbi:hypothetical protein PIB19_04250 [Sphingomonas sp. 7/4-4]|uniref:hypothetical protein n=1 Tax=Sphingomonas sp. 7/4-4 TaxID=3018446 RepID=UPI0022F405E7|nr:hypothetical protein [Sphingomonas sp. 7/4-4]WBY08676.1 hypothetical protein PIB19_04250 [Sphingomonas sp. 7/4-4]